MLAGVEAVHVVDEEMVPVLDVDANQGLLREGELGQPQVVQVAARDGWHVVSKQKRAFNKGTVSRESVTDGTFSNLLKGLDLNLLTSLT
jgi:hypothetical protein